MKSLRPVVGLLGAAGLVAIVSGCSGGAVPQAGSTIPTASALEARLHPLTNPQRVLALLAERPAPRAAYGRSRMSPSAKSSSLLYASNKGNGTLNVYSNPAWKPLGVLLGLTTPYTFCIDAAQDVYVTDFTSDRVTEYAHGTIAPLRTIVDHQGITITCAIDPTTGNLAVANWFGPSARPGNVIVFAGAKGSPSKFTALNLIEYFFVGYDNSGNLFVDGVNASSKVVLAELPKGKSAFKPIAMNATLGFPGGLEWDGEFLAVGDQLTNTIYQFKVSGSKATMQGSTTLNGAVDVFQFFLTGGSPNHPQATAVIGADFGADAITQWQYAAGGSPVKSITGLDGPEGTAVSK